VARARSGLPKPFKPALPMTVTVRMKAVESAEEASRKPGVQRVNDYTVQGRVDRHCDVVKWLLGTGLDMPETRP